MSATPESIGGWALLLALISMAIFVIGTIVTLINQWKAAKLAGSASNAIKDKVNSAPVGGAVPGPPVSDLTDMLKALTGTIEAVTKAGPALASLAASMLFLAIAAWTVTQRQADEQKCSIAKGTDVLLTDGKSTAVIPVACDHSGKK